MVDYRAGVGNITPVGEHPAWAFTWLGMGGGRGGEREGGGMEVLGSALLLTL